MRSQIVISRGRGGRRYLPYVFTEQDAAMLSSVLRSQQAILVNIAIMRVFVRLREIMATHKELAVKLRESEGRIHEHDEQIVAIFEAIHHRRSATFTGKLDEMNCPKCQFEQEETNTECVRCGLIFEKYYRRRKPEPDLPSLVAETEDKPPRQRFSLKDFLFEVEIETNPLYFGGRVLLFIVLLVWGLKLILTPFTSDYTMSSFMHLVNLPFHEAGHVILRPLGHWMMSLGGTLGQLLMPTICMGVFLLKARDVFGASVCMWWLGENFMDIAPYINDARALKLPLLGGNMGETSPYGFHDWEYILSEINLLHYDHILAQVSDKLGAIIILASFAWGGCVLFRQYRRLNSR